MKTLHTAYRVQDLARSLDFYSAVGFRELGRVELPDATTLVMLHLPGDGDVVTLELVSGPWIDALEIGNGFSHIAVQVDDLDSKLTELSAAGLSVPDPELPGGAGGPKTCFLHDPDGYRLELVQWPPGHADRMTSADFR
jgi:lactoylglutathione lyase